MIDGLFGVAIHGAGNVASAHAASWRKNPFCRIVSVSSRRKESAQKLVARLHLDCPAGEDFEQVLHNPQVDVVSLSGPNYTHAPQAIAAAKAGKHIWVEKPMAITAEENHALRDAVAQAGVKSIVGFVLRWNPLFENLKTLLAAGVIGKLFFVEVDYWHGIGLSYQGRAWGAHQIQTGGSAMLLAGCHGVDAVRWFSSDEVEEVVAYGNNPKGLYEYPANVTAIFKFRGGAIGKTSVLLDAEMPYTFNIDLVGTEGTLRDNHIWAKKLFPGQTGWNAMETILPTSADVHHHPFDAQVNHFVECLRTNRESHCNVADGYRTHELCLAIDRSVELGGKPVRLPLD